MIYPKFLKNGDTIGVTAPSYGAENEIDLKRIKLASENFLKHGINSVFTDNCYKNDVFGSCDPQTRAKELESLFLDKNVNAIVGLSGGEFLVEMLSYLDLQKIIDNPKWLQGYSDITGLSFMMTTLLDIATIYCYNYKTYAMNNWHKSLNNSIELLTGNLIAQESFDLYENERSEHINGDEPFNLDSKVLWEGLNGEQSICFSGRIIGGCLDLIDILSGTRFDGAKQFVNKYKDDGIVWYFDNCELSCEDVIRSMWKFKELGYFDYTKGIIFGRTMLEVSNCGISFKEAIKYSLSDLNAPIILNADIGHKPPQFAIINGAIADVKLENEKGEICFRLE